MDRAIVESASLLGLSSLKEEQTQCIKEFIKGRDVFAILPTGYGKTFCYSTLPAAFDIFQKRAEGNKAIIIVVSPLTALICDQVRDLLDRNVSAGYLCSDSTADVKKKVTNGEYAVVFMGPEQLVDKWRSLFTNTVYKTRLVGLIVDEAHCVIKW